MPRDACEHRRTGDRCIRELLGKSDVLWKRSPVDIAMLRRTKSFREE